jgi:hypothetical protein
VNQLEITKLITICSANYRNWPEKGKEEDTITLWELMLADIPLEIAKVAVQQHIGKSVYPPTVADIREIVNHISIPQEKTAIEAWGDVKTAIRRYGSYNEKKAMDSLSGVTRKVVEYIGFKTLCMSEDEMADRAHFLKMYEVVAKRERDDALLLPQTRDMMLRLQIKTQYLIEEEGA